MPRFEPAGFVPTLDEANEPAADAPCDDEAPTVQLPVCDDAFAITMVAGGWTPQAAT